VTFEFFALRFLFRAEDSVRFPPGKAGNVLRGAFGTLFRRHPDYERFFEPAGPGPSGLKDRPRPFVFRAAHLDGRTFGPGDPFHFDVNVFSVETDPFVSVFAELARQGLGPGRGRAELLSAEKTQVSIPLEPEPGVGRIAVAFLTPTELKGPTPDPEFATLFARARDRVSTLRALYGPGPLAIDFRAMGDRARAVRMTRCRVRHEEVERRSSKTGHVHSLGGFTGEADYQGELAEFLPILRAAAWTGVGRHTVWGNGQIAVAALPPEPTSSRS